MRKTATLTFVMLALVPAASASPPAHTPPTAGVKVANCDAGKATFVGHMHALRGSSQLSMRFDLLEQYGDRPLTKVAAPDLRSWRRSRAGVQDYSYSQTITDLLPGESYRAQVQFRWLDASGKQVTRVRRTSGACRQAGDLPNLRVLDVAAHVGQVAATESYTVTVVNAGAMPATRVPVQLIVDGATPDTATVDSLAPGEVRALHFTGPVCRHRVRATVDPANEIHETVEADDSLAARCPLQS